jgi:hypothetical protein
MKDDEVPVRDDLLASPTFALKIHKQSAAWRCPIKPIFAAVPFVASWHKCEVPEWPLSRRCWGDNGRDTDIV